jgi:hypothetical protein
MNFRTEKENDGVHLTLSFQKNKIKIAIHIYSIMHKKIEGSRQIHS